MGSAEAHGQQATQFRDRLAAPLQPLWRRGFRVLFVIDAVVLYGLMVTITQIRFGSVWPDFSRSYYYAGFAIATAIHLVIGYLTGLYEREPRLGARPWLPRVALAMAIGVAFESMAFLVLDRYLMPRLNLFFLAIAGTIALTLTRWLSRLFARQRLGPVRALLVGSPDECDQAAQHLKDADTPIVVVASIDGSADLVEQARSNSATDVLLLGTSSYSQVFPQPLGTLEMAGINMFQRVSAPQTLLGLGSLTELGGMPFVPLHAESFPGYKLTLKRGFDLVLLVVASPIILLVCLFTLVYVRVVAGSPVLYRQTRISRGGKPFQMLKFRTMRRDAEIAGAQLSMRGDDRIVRGMAWTRATRLDELPQLCHVLTGKMSVVGPRPERPEFTVQLAQEVPGYERRLELPPGLTGLAQVHGRYATAAEYKIGYDLQYLVHWSILLDVEIIVRTIWVVLSRRV